MCWLAGHLRLQVVRLRAVGRQKPQQGKHLLGALLGLRTLLVGLLIVQISAVPGHPPFGSRGYKPPPAAPFGPYYLHFRLPKQPVGHTFRTICHWILKFCSADFVPKRGKSMGRRGVCMPFLACESRKWMHSVPLSRLYISGVVGLMVSYLIHFLLFR